MSDIPLSREDRDALAFWGVDTVLSAAIPTSGTVNRTILIQTSDSWFVLRISCRERERVEWEHACISWAADHGLPACRPILLPGGGTIVRHAGAFYALFLLARGQQVSRGLLTDTHARMAGECLARVHVAFETFPAERARIKPLSVSVPSALVSIPPIEAAIKALPIHTETETAALEHLAARRDWLQRSVEKAEGIQGRLATLPQALVHGDYQETNLFFEDGSVSAVIDWDQSGLTARGWEVVRALHLMLRLAPDLCDAFLCGYRSVLPLGEGELQESATCYGVLADGNLWVYEAAYLEGNERAKQFIDFEPFAPFEEQWEMAELDK